MSQRRYDLVIFDWDGTLMDSAGLICDCLGEAAIEAGLPVLDEPAYRQIIGLGLPEALRTLYPGYCDRPELLESMRQGYIRAFSRAAPAAPYRGVTDGLAQLRATGLRLAVATGKSRVGLDKALAQTGWQGLFHSSRCADETRSKPHPLMLEEILAELGVAPERAVMIGDTSFDLEMAAALGMDRIALHYGAHSIEVLERHQPVFGTADFVELTRWLLGEE